LRRVAVLALHLPPIIITIIPPQPPNFFSAFRPEKWQADQALVAVRTIAVCEFDE